MTSRSANQSFTKMNCRIANIASGYTNLPRLTVKSLIDSAGFWRKAAANNWHRTDRERMSYLARAEALQAAARDLSYKLTDGKECIYGCCILNTNGD